MYGHPKAVTQHAAILAPGALVPPIIEADRGQPRVSCCACSPITKPIKDDKEPDSPRSISERAQK